MTRNQIQIGHVFLSFKPFDDRLQPSWILVLGLAKTKPPECYSVTGRGHGSYQFENGITWKWDKGGREQEWQKGHAQNTDCTRQDKTWRFGEDTDGCQFLPDRTLPLEETSPEREPLKNDGWRWMKSAPDMFNFSFKWSQRIVPYSNISGINNILDCQLRPGGFLKALHCHSILGTFLCIAPYLPIFWVLQLRHGVLIGCLKSYRLPGTRGRFRSNAKSPTPIPSLFPDT